MVKVIRYATNSSKVILKEAFKLSMPCNMDIKFYLSTSHYLYNGEWIFLGKIAKYRLMFRIMNGEPYHLPICIMNKMM